MKRICILVLTLLFGAVLMQGETVYATEYTEILSELAQEGTIYKVDPEGTGDFATIQDGVDCVESGDTLLIYPGIYKESVVIENKTVNLIGFGSEYCILMACADNYHNIPLTIGAGRVYGLTICGTRTEEYKASSKDYCSKQESYDATDLEAIYTWQDRYPGYAVHVDQAYSIGKMLWIENCRVISDNNQCIGIGSWINNEIMLTNSQLFAKGGSGCIFIHNTSYLPEGGVGKITVKACELKSYVCPYVIAVHSLENANPVYLTFQNVKVSAVAYESKERYNDTNINTWYRVEQLENPAVQELLKEAGYCTAQEGELVHRFNERQHREYKRMLEQQSSLLSGWPQLEEGITYLEKTEEISPAQGRTRHSIDIKNGEEEQAGDGWCGLSDIYLTSESYGNTLPEMDYPKIGIE